MIKKIWGFLFRQKRKLFVVLLAAALLGFINYTIFVNLNKTDSLFCEKVAAENTNNWIQIIAGFFIILGSIVAVWQYALTAHAERAKMSSDRIQKAIDLSEYYKDNILSKYLPLIYVFEKSKILDIIKCIKKKDIRNFDKSELDSLLNQNQLDEIKNLRKSEAFFKAVVEAEYIYGMDLNLEKYTNITRGEKGEVIKIEFNNDAIIRKFMSSQLTVVLNNMEYFAMNFTHKTADESVVYQSLHQTYTEIVYILYYNIAISNMDSSKYYTNVIELYNIWHDRCLQKQNESVEKVRKQSVVGSIAPTIS